MNARIEIGGRAYIPLTAVPFVTGGFFTTGHVADLIANYESFCDHRYHGVVSAFRVTADGRLVCLDPRSFLPLADIWFRKREVPPAWSGAGIVVPEAEVRKLMQTILDETSAAGTLDVNRPPACWDIDAPLPPRVEKEIHDSIRTPLNRTALRKNSRQANIDRILAAIDYIAREAASKGVPFDRTNLPGCKRDFIKVLHCIDARIAAAPSTLDSYYFPSLHLRWRRRARPEDAGPLLALFGLTVG